MLAAYSGPALRVAGRDAYAEVQLGSGWWVTLLGWPAVGCAVVAFSIAVAAKSRVAAVVGCLLVAPMFLYLSLMPNFLLPALLALALLCVLAWRIRESSRLVSGLMALPAAAILAWLAYGLLSQ